MPRFFSNYRKFALYLGLICSLLNFNLELLLF